MVLGGRGLKGNVMTLMASLVCWLYCRSAVGNVSLTELESTCLVHQPASMRQKEQSRRSSVILGLVGAAVLWLSRIYGSHGIAYLCNDARLDVGNADGKMDAEKEWRICRHWRRMIDRFLPSLRV